MFTLDVQQVLHPLRKRFRSSASTYSEIGRRVLERHELVLECEERRRAVPVEAAAKRILVREVRATRLGSHVKQFMGLVEQARLLDRVKGVW